MRIAPARDITPGGRERDLPLPCDQAGAQFDLHILRGGSLRGGKARDIVMRPADIVLERLRHHGHRRVDLIARHGDLALPAIELPGIFQCHLPAARAQARQHHLHGVGDIGGSLRGLTGGGFEVCDGHLGISFPSQMRPLRRSGKEIPAHAIVFFQPLKPGFGISEKPRQRPFASPRDAASIRSSAPSKSRV